MSLRERCVTWGALSSHLLKVRAACGEKTTSRHYITQVPQMIVCQRRRLCPAVRDRCKRVCVGDNRMTAQSLLPNQCSEMIVCLKEVRLSKVDGRSSGLRRDFTQRSSVHDWECCKNHPLLVIQQHTSITCIFHSLHCCYVTGVETKILCLG